MKNLFDEYRRLSENLPKDGTSYFNVCNVIGEHKLGVSPEGHPIFFIASQLDNYTPAPVSLKHLKVLYNVECSVLLDNGRQETGLYCLVELCSMSEGLCKIFLSVFQRFLEENTQKSTAIEIKRRIDLYVTLFMGLNTPSRLTLQGLWAELLLIAHSEDAEYMIRAWHATNTSKFDFDDGVCRIEVKSTSALDERKHRFSHHQLIVPEDGVLIVASVPVVVNDFGVGILELIERIRKTNITFDSECKLYKLVIDVFGAEQNTDFYYFDEHSALAYLRFYDSKDVPKLTNIPNIYSSVSFDCDFSSINSVCLDDYLEYYMINNFIL